MVTHSQINSDITRCIIAFAFMVSVFLSLTHGVSPLAEYFTRHAFIYLLLPFFVTLSITSLSLCIAFSCTKICNSHYIDHFYRSIGVEVLACTAGIVGLFSYAQDMLAGQTIHTSTFAGILLGFGFALLIIRSGELAWQIQAAHILRISLASFGMGGILFGALSFLPAPYEFPFIFAEFIAACFLLAFMRKFNFDRKTNECSNNTQQHGEIGQHLHATKHVTDSAINVKMFDLKAACCNDEASSPLFARMLFSAVWQALGAIGICSLIYGLTWDPDLAFVVLDSTQIRIQLILGSLIVFAGALITPVSPLGRRIWSIWKTSAMPLCIAFAMVVPSLLLINYNAFLFVLGFLREYCFIACYAVAWVHLRYTCLNSTLASGAPLATYALSALIGMLIIPTIGEAGRQITLVLSVIYLAGFFIIPTRTQSIDTKVNETRSDNTECATYTLPVDIDSMSNTATPGDAFAHACANYIKKGRLTPREAEVFIMLARGHSPAYVAGELTLSDSTIRTHVRNIYKKLNITSREELICLFEQKAL